MPVKVFAITHKSFVVPSDPVYIPLQVGRALAEDLGYVGDHTGDHISEKNKSYCELTGMYWIWKNIRTSDYVGICHYRRYPVNDNNVIMNEVEYEEILKEYDLITTKKLALNFSYYDGYAANHYRKDLDVTSDVIREKYPEYHDLFLKRVHQNHTYFGNIIITNKELFDRYSEWLFTILFEAERRIDLTDYDDYHKRVFGFISEFLLMIWVEYNQLKVYECKIGMTAEKTETTDLKEQLSVFFQNRDLQGAKNYFLEILKNRPDVLMEASDVTGELKLAMQMIATFDKEYEETGKSLLDRGYSFYELIPLFSKLNRLVSESSFAEIQKTLLSSFDKGAVSIQMLEIAIQIQKESVKGVKPS